MVATLIQGGRLFDGTESPSRIANVLVDDGRVIEISEGEITPPDNARIVDASGQWVMPGFIDNHTHYDGELLVEPGLGESVRHGVTTVLLGGCSLSFVCADVEDCCDMFTRVEAFPREILYPVLRDQKNWSTPSEWINHISSLPFGPNIASFLGHSDIRVVSMGIERSVQPGEKPTPAEVRQMSDLLQQALDAGFLGLSMQHNPWDKMDGRFWSKMLPSAYAKAPERNALTKFVRQRGAHLQGVPNLVNRFNALWYMVQSSSFFFRRPMKTSLVAMMNLKGDPYLRSLISGIAAMFNKLCGANFRFQAFPVPFRVLAEGMELVIFEEFPTGELARHLSRDLEKRNTTLMDPEYRKKFKRHYRNKLAPKVWQKDFGDAYVMEAPDKSFIGKSFTDIAEERGQHPVDTFLDLVVEMDQDILWETTIGNVDPEKYGKLYNDKNGILGFADSGAHINNMAFYNFPLRVLRYVQASHERGKPLMSYEKTIWRLTKENADFFNLDAGHLAVGKRADITVIDPEKLGDHVHEYHTAPFLGSSRLVNRNDDVVSLVMINGNVAWEAGDFSAAFGNERFGQFLKGKHEYSTTPQPAASESKQSRDRVPAGA